MHPLDTLYNKYDMETYEINLPPVFFNDDRGGEDCCSGPDSSYKSAVGAQLFITRAPPWLLLDMSDNPP
jgi:hypothetical protein